MSDTVTKDSEAEIQYPPSILEDVSKLVQRVQTFTGAAGAAIALREGDDMVCRASRGNNAPDVGMTLSLDGSFTGLAVTGMKAVRCDDTENDPRVDPEISRALRIKSMAVVPVLSGMRVSGVIATFSSNVSAFSDTHMAVLKTMADGLGANIQRFLEGQGVPTGAPAAAPPLPKAAVVPPPAPPAPPRVQAPPPPAPKVEVPKFEAPKFEAPKVEAPKPAPVAAPAPKIEPPVAKPVPVATPAPKIESPVAKPAVAAAAAAAAAPAIEKAEPKKFEPKPQQGKWKPVAAPKQEEAPVAEAKSVAKAEPKPEAKAQPRIEPKPQPIAAPSFSYDAKSDDEGKKSPMIFVGIGIVAVIVIIAGYFMFGRSSKPAATPAATTTSAPAASTPAPTPATTTAAVTPAASTKPEPAKNDKIAAKSGPVDTTTVTKPAPAPLVVASTPSSTPSGNKTADVAPPSIAFGGGAGPALDIPVTTSAPKLSAPAPANAVIVPSRLLQRVNPSYPSAAKQYRIEGAVSLSATIGPDGRVVEAKVLSGPPMLRDSAITAVRQWKYAPSTVNGRAVESSVNIVLQFKMP